MRSCIAIAALTLIASVLVSFTAHAADKVIRIGFQKYGNLVLLKGKGDLERRLAPLGFQVAWTEFPAGPPLLEAIGSVGEAPPIFAQAAGTPFVYVAHEPPAPKGEAILVPKDSKIASVRDLKGKRVALNKGSNVHYLLVRALERARIKYSDIEPVFLAPADARAAFERGAVDAWVIWDPFQAAAETTAGARTLIDGTGLVANHQFYIADQKFTDANPQIVDAVLAAVGDIDRWAKDNTKAVASIGIPAPILEVALAWQTYGVKPLDPQVVAEQQRIADAFHTLGLIPKPIVVATQVRRTGS